MLKQSLPARPSVSDAEINLYPLDVDTFHEWLTEQASDAPVGMACDDLECPLSRFLSALYRAPFLVRHADYERFDTDLLHEIKGVCFPLPPWAVCFVSLVDDAAGYEPEPVSSASALSDLREACRVHGVRLQKR